jgi:hypothetical protein
LLWLVNSKLLSSSSAWHERLYIGASLAAKFNMFDLNAANLIGGLIFGSIGFVAFIYGKRMNLWKPMVCGLGLMIFPYFVSNTVVMYAIGLFGSAALLFLRE